MTRSMLKLCVFPLVFTSRSAYAARSAKEYTVFSENDELLSMAEPSPSPKPAQELVFGVSANAASDVEREVQSDTLICGGNEIYEDMKVRKTAEKIALVKWGEHLETAQSFNRAQQREMDKLQRELDEKTVRVRKMAAASDIEAVSDAEIERLITLAVTDAANQSADPVAAAEKKRCRTPHFTNNNEEMEASLPVIASAANLAFWNEASKLLEDQDDPTQSFKKFEKDSIDLKCDAMLVKAAKGKSQRRDEDLQWTYCDDVCIMFERIGVALNDRNSYVWGKDIDPRLEKLEQLQRNIDYIQANIQECKAAKSTIEMMRNSVGAYADKMQQKQDLFFDAEADVQEAQMEMEGLEEKQTELKGKFDAADKKLKSALQAHTEVVRQHQTVVDEWNKVSLALKTTKGQIAQLKSDFGAVKKAEGAMDSVKMSVITLVSSMNIFYQNRVRQPLLDLQITPAVPTGDDTLVSDVEEWFKGPSQLDEFAQVQEGLGSLEKTCGEATKVFSQNKFVDFNPVCEVGAATSLTDQVKDAVRVDQDLAKRNLKKLQDFLNPYHGISVDVSSASSDDDDFEPYGIRKLLSPYGTTMIFSKYLQKWQNGKEFQQLYQQAQQSRSSLDASLTDLREKEKDLIRQLTLIMDKLDMWQKKVDEALAIAEKKGQKVSDLQELMKNLSGEIEETKKKITNYQCHQEERERSFSRAKEKLEWHYKQGRKGLKAQVRKN
eukprot:TRINITY_DN14929_c0_g2_i1.p1 TRINITY_DN14929_c0_g2~~TRINITY_DN14929_c0_g2_i1.p1  ORF type:complete len:720 (-),score=196.96 TRINITY_DN14929_c0_g2_i1:106-2265(-)